MHILTVPSSPTVEHLLAPGGKEAMSRLVSPKTLSKARVSCGRRLAYDLTFGVTAPVPPFLDRGDLTAGNRHRCVRVSAPVSVLTTVRFVSMRFLG